MVTRLVPLFPFNLQNFAYGLTRIPFWTYVGMTAARHPAGNHRLHPCGGGVVGGGARPASVDPHRRGGPDRRRLARAPMARAPEPGRAGPPRAGPAESTGMNLSVVVPVLDDARNLETLLSELASSCPGAEVIVADGGSQDGSAESPPGARACAWWRARRGRGRQMNAGAARGPRRGAPVPPRGHDAAAGSGRRRPEGARRRAGRLRSIRRPVRQPPAGVPPGRRAHEPSLATDGDLYRRPGDLRAPRGVRGARRLPGDRAHGGRRPLAATQARGSPGGAPPAGHDVGAEVGARGRGADDRPDVGAPRALRCGVGPDRLHRWYYGSAAPTAPDGRVGGISSGGA